MSSLDTITHIKVFPGIGMARVGNSPEYFIGPEFPGNIPNLGKNYKDTNGLVKPQAARFRVYGFDADGNVVAELNQSNGASIEWNVHMRNLKAANYAFQGKFGFDPGQYRNPGVGPNGAGTDPNSRDSLIINPGEKSITGVSQNGANAVQLDGGKIFSGIGTADIPTSLFVKGATGCTKVTYQEKEVSLGRLETDAQGRLIVVGGAGEAGCVIEPPIILQKGAAYLAELLGEAQAASPSSGPFPNTFYSNTIKVDLTYTPYPDKVILSSNNDATGDVYVDDQVIIKVNGIQVFSHDFSNGGSGVITPTNPLDITEQIKPYFGQHIEVTIEYQDLYPGSKGASDFYFCYTNQNPTSNGNSYFNNPGWYDDTGGGSVNATVTIGGKTFSTNNEVSQRGWIAVSPPKYVPTMNNVVSLLDLQLAMYPEQDPVSGTVNFAFIDKNGVPNFASGTTSDFHALSNLSTGKANPTIVSYQGNAYMAYTNNSGDFLIAVSTDGGTTWGNNTIVATDSNGQSFDKTTSYAPSLCVFNGLLQYVVIIESEGFSGKEGKLYVGTSTDGINFVFDEANAGGGVESIGAFSAPSAVAYNGQLYVSFLDTNNTIVIAHQYLEPSGTNYYYKFDTLSKTVLNDTIPCLAVFFGELYCVYTATDNTAAIGSYNNYSPAPSEPATVSFNFNSVPGAPSSTVSPSIGSSHGKLYYAIVDENSNLQLAIVAPGLQNISFESQGTVATSSPISITNFSNLSFYRDVYPILKTVTDYAWVNEPAFQGHAPGSMGDFLRNGAIQGYANPNLDNNPYRVFVFKAIRPAEQLTPLVPPPPAAIPEGAIPNGGIQTGRLMPHLFGEGGSPLENNFNDTNFPNQWLSLTPHQLWKIQEWVNGNFETGSIPTPPASFDDIPLAEQPAALNFSALEPTVGGGFHPGIELTYNMKEPGYFAEAFRFADNITNNGMVVQAITPGSVAGYMSIPWQGDFWSCNISWWAAMRPDIVVTMDKSLDPPKLNYKPWFRGEAVGIPPNADNIDGYEGGYEHMVRYWSYFGFVVPTGETDEGMFVMDETERAPCLDDASAPCVPVNPPEAVHLGVAQSETNSTEPFPDTFYKNAVDVIIPAAETITLSSTEDGTGSIFVDDQCIVKVNGTQVYLHDFSNGNNGRITPIPPVDLTSVLKPYTGIIITLSIEYVDLHPGKKSASDFWLSYS